MGTEFTEADVATFLQEIDRDGNGVVLFDGVFVLLYLLYTNLLLLLSFF
jgi:hypothetical protein